MPVDMNLSQLEVEVLDNICIFSVKYSKTVGMENPDLYTKINKLFFDIKLEVNNFIDFLVAKKELETVEKIPKFGCAKGQIYISPDFDEPLDDFKEYM